MTSTTSIVTLKPDTVDFAALVQSNSNKPIDTQTKIVQKLNENFSTDEQKWFCANMYMYSNYHPTNDYPIDFDKVYSMIGFSTKANAKRSLMNNFVADEDYKVLLIRRKERTRGGHNAETIMMNADTFKNLCMISRTEKGKAIRKYYVKLENVMNEVIKYEKDSLTRAMEHHKEEKVQLTKAVEHNKQLLESTKKVLESQTEAIKKMLKRRYYGSKPEQTVYVYQNEADNPKSLIKIGKTTNVNLREAGYNTTNKSGKFVHVRTCYNCDVLERVVHHILDKYRVHRNQEWFEVSVELAIETVDSAQMFMDGMIHYSDAICKSNLLDGINKIVDTIKQNSTDTDNRDITACIGVNQSTIKVHEEKGIYERLAEERQRLHEQDIQKIVVPKESRDRMCFTQFISDCCVVKRNDKKFYCSTKELVAAYRMWSRSTSQHLMTALRAYMNENFKHGKKAIKEYENDNALVAVYTGVQLKKREFQPKDPNNPTIHEKFVMEQCKVGALHRVSFKDLNDEYEKWFASHTSNPKYALDKADRLNLRTYLCSEFLECTVHLSGNVHPEAGVKVTNTSYGVYGITLKSDNTNIGIKGAPSLRKKVLQIDPDTDKVVHIFQSVTSAANHFGIMASGISTDIKFGRLRDGFLLKKADNVESAK